MVRKKQRPIRGLKCQFCQSGKNPDYKEVETLKNYVSDRGKIISRTRTGVCAKHQRRLAREIKRTRYLALLPFITKV
jgi:small subunit ribosomal protein S18